MPRSLPCLFSVLFVLLSAISVQAEESRASQRVVVTSLEKCYEQLDPQDVAEIKNNYEKQYQECQRRLAVSLKKKQSAPAKDAKPPAPVPSSNFYRVQKNRAEKKSENLPPPAPYDGPVVTERVPLR